MIHRLLSFYRLPFDHEVCHLFEHVVIRSFLLLLRKNQHSRAFFGNLHGTTIDSSIFFEVSVHDEKVMHLFEEHLAQLHDIPQTVLAHSIAHVEAETRSKITVEDSKLLDQQFKELAKIFSHSHTEKVTQGAALKTTTAPNNFHEVAIIINVYTISENVRKAFLCLYPALLDIVRDAAIDFEAAYPAGVSPLATRDDGIGVAQKYIIEKSVDCSKLEKTTSAYLQKYDAKTHMTELAAYAKSYAEDRCYMAQPIHFYEQVDIITTQRELAHLITVENMQQLIRNTTVRIVPLSTKLKKLTWNN